MSYLLQNWWLIIRLVWPKSWYSPVVYRDHHFRTGNKLTRICSGSKCCKKKGRRIVCGKPYWQQYFWYFGSCWYGRFYFGTGNWKKPDLFWYDLFIDAVTFSPLFFQKEERPSKNRIGDLNWHFYYLCPIEGLWCLTIELVEIQLKSMFQTQKIY